MKIENVRVFNFEGALRGMRNPKNSWDLSDSHFTLAPSSAAGNKDTIIYKNEECCEIANIGPKDLKLAQILIRAGAEHRKFLRQIQVSMDITAPLYWWKEFDTYKVGTVANSTSTMHTIGKKPITIHSFEISDLISEEDAAKEFNYDYFSSTVPIFIDFLEALRATYVETGSKKIWKELIRWLPMSWLQTRTVTMNYENLLNMCSLGQRRTHKLVEWSETFVKAIRQLPYAQEFIFLDEVTTD